MAKDRWIPLIAALKLFKGVLLLASGIGLLKLLHKDVADLVMHWINVNRTGFVRFRFCFRTLTCTTKL
jgi:hypothetical protein